MKCHKFASLFNLVGIVSIIPRLGLFATGGGKVPSSP